MAVNYADRRALAARATLLARLRDEFGATVAAELDFDPNYTRRVSLRHVDRELFEPGAGTVPPDGGVRLLECAGERGEAEAVGLEIARLLDSGVDPSEVVIALRRPSVDGPLFATVLRELGVPVALEAELALATTAVGRSLLALCRAASPEGEPADLLAYPGRPVGVAPGAVWTGSSRRWPRRGRERCRPLGPLGEAARPPCTHPRCRARPPASSPSRRVPAGSPRAVHAEGAPLAGERSAVRRSARSSSGRGSRRPSSWRGLALRGSAAGYPRARPRRRRGGARTAGVRA